MCSVTPGSSWVFLAPVPGSATSPRSPGSSYWRTVVQEAESQALGVFIAAGMALPLGLSAAMCARANVYGYVSNNSICNHL